MSNSETTFALAFLPTFVFVSETVFFFVLTFGSVSVGGFTLDLIFLLISATEFSFVFSGSTSRSSVCVDFLACQVSV